MYRAFNRTNLEFYNQNFYKMAKYLTPNQTADRVEDLTARVEELEGKFDAMVENIDKILDHSETLIKLVTHSNQQTETPENEMD